MAKHSGQRIGLVIPFIRVGESSRRSMQVNPLAPGLRVRLTAIHPAARQSLRHQERSRQVRHGGGGRR